MEMNIKTLKSGNWIYEMEDYIKEEVRILNGYLKHFEADYKSKYIDLIFELYNRGYELASLNYEELDIEDKEDLKIVSNKVNKFVKSYSKVVQYFDFHAAIIDNDQFLGRPGRIGINFMNWKAYKFYLLDKLEA